MFESDLLTIVGEKQYVKYILCGKIPKCASDGHFTMKPQERICIDADAEACKSQTMTILRI